LLASLLVIGACSDGDRESDGEALARDIVGARLGVSGHGLLVRDDGVVTWGGSIYGARGVPDPLNVSMTVPARPDIGGPSSAVVSVGAGRDHSCAVFEDGRLQCWGRNDFGQLGLGDTEDRGDEPGEMGDALPFVDLGDGVRAVAVTGGFKHTCALLDDGRVKCWGSNGSGELGQGDTDARGDEPGEMGDALPPVELGDGRRAVEVDAGGARVCVVLDDGAVKCWGHSSSESSALGRSDVSNIGDEPGHMGEALPEIDLGSDAHVVTISAGDNHTCAVLRGGGLKCWGQGSQTDPCPHEPTCVYPRPRFEGGRLGYGDMERRGAGPQMGDNLPLVDVGTTQRVVAVDAAAVHTCALLSTGHLKCWGAGGYNKLGDGGGLDLGDQPGEMGDALATVDLGVGGTVTAFGCWTVGCCARLDDDGVKCWGGNGPKDADNDYLTGDALPYVELPE